MFKSGRRKFLRVDIESSCGGRDESVGKEDRVVWDTSRYIRYLFRVALTGNE
jgi:hypothetical protein